MKTYLAKIKEESSMIVPVEAESEKEAYRLIEEMANRDELDLTNLVEDCIDCEIIDPDEPETKPTEPNEQPEQPTLFTLFVENAVYLDDDEFPLFHETHESGVIRARVNFELRATVMLEKIADSIRRKNGIKRTLLYPLGAEADGDVWYNFYIDLIDSDETIADLYFVVCNTDEKDNEKDYHIDLSKAEQRVIIHDIDNQCREAWGQSCEDLLAESRAAMTAE